MSAFIESCKPEKIDKYITNAFPWGLVGYLKFCFAIRHPAFELRVRSRDSVLYAVKGTREVVKGLSTPSLRRVVV